MPGVETTTSGTSRVEIAGRAFLVLQTRNGKQQVVNVIGCLTLREIEGLPYPFAGPGRNRNPSERLNGARSPSVSRSKRTATRYRRNGKA